MGHRIIEVIDKILAQTDSERSEATFLEQFAELEKLCVVSSALTRYATELRTSYHRINEMSDELLCLRENTMNNYIEELHQMRNQVYLM